MEKDNGFKGETYTKIVNLLFGAIVNSKDLLTYEGKVFMVILFKTVGFQKEVDWLSYKQICRHTGIKYKTRISESIKSLVDKNLIIKDGKYFEINQDFEKWLTLGKENINSVKEFYQYKKLRNSVTNDNEKLRNSVTEVTEKRNSKLRNSVMPSTDNIITDKTITDNNIFRSDQIEEIINYLNSKSDKNFRSNNKNTIKEIKARLNDGYTIIDLKKVIDIKTSQWKNTEYDKYLRPKTLFGSKFEDYINERIIKGGEHGKTGKHFENGRDYTDEDRRKIVENFYAE